MSIAGFGRQMMLRDDGRLPRYICCTARQRRRRQQGTAIARLRRYHFHFTSARLSCLPPRRISTLYASRRRSRRYRRRHAPTTPSEDARVMIISFDLSSPF